MEDLQCRFCKSYKIRKIMDFGDVALAGAFLKPNQFSEEIKYPLQLYFCENCYLVQIINHVPPQVLFNDYFYYSSAISTLRNHFNNYANEVYERFLQSKDATVVEIGCNDGVLLNPLSRLKISKIIGVDPATKIVNSIDNPDVFIVNDFFSESSASRIEEQFGKANLIIANNVYAHIDDIHDVTRGITNLLSNDGVFIFENHYLGEIIERLQYDMIYHEHIFYYSLISLENFFNKYDMEIFDIKSIPIHAGSMRYYVRKKGTILQEKISNAVLDLRREELLKGYEKLDTYINYAQHVEKTKSILMHLLTDLKNNHMEIWGYGASGRANTIIQYCGIDKMIIDFVIDDAPAKHDYFTPGSHFKIIPRTMLDDNPPDYILVFAWSFLNEVIKKNMAYLKNGGKLIIPLPEVKVLSWNNNQIMEEVYYN